MGSVRVFTDTYGFSSDSRATLASTLQRQQLGPFIGIILRYLGLKTRLEVSQAFNTKKKKSLVVSATCVKPSIRLFYNQLY